MSLVAVASPAVWTLDDALRLVRGVQGQLHEWHWHIALGGGVLNRGESLKDADLYVLPFDDGKSKLDIIDRLHGLWGESEPIGYGHPSVYQAKLKFNVDGKRIDVFVGRAE